MTTLYVLLGGLYSVVITNVIQTVILTVASIVIAVVAYADVDARDASAAVLPDGWTSLWPAWQLDDTQACRHRLPATSVFGALVIVWVSRGCC